MKEVTRVGTPADPVSGGLVVPSAGGRGWRAGPVGRLFRRAGFHAGLAPDAEVEWRALREGEWQRRRAPAVGPAGVPWEFAAIAERIVPVARAARLVAAQCHGVTGAVALADGRYLADAVRFFSGRVHPVFVHRRAGRGRRLVGEAVAVATPGATNLFHWLFEALPRLELARRSGWLGPDPWILAGSLRQAFHRKTLQALGCAAEKIVDLESVGWAAADVLVHASAPYFSDDPPPWVGRWLRETVGARALAGEGPSGMARRLYVSRADAAGGCLANEDDVVRRLTARRFEVVCPGRLPWEEQVRLFAGAEVVVGVHGAALAHLVWCRPGTVVVEILPPSWVNPCYWSLAEAGNLRYAAVFGAGRRTPVGDAARDRGAAFAVDGAELEAVVTGTMAEAGLR